MGGATPATGCVYLDVSAVTADLSEAMTLARETHAITRRFRLSAMEAVPVAIVA